jgi:putative DNA primase/helicase
MSALDKVLDALRAKGLKPQKGRHGSWKCQCPAHDDRSPSLSVTERAKGRVGIRCFAGCATQDVMERLGLSDEILYAEAKRKNSRQRKVVTYIYTDEAGIPLHCTVRWEPKRFSQARILANGDKAWGYGAGWYGKSGAKDWLPAADRRTKEEGPATLGDVWFDAFDSQVIYRLPQIRLAIHKGEPIYVVEGEKDVESINEILKAGGLPGCATCQAMGAGKWLDRHSASLSGAAKVVIIPDRDEPGFAHAMMVHASLARAGISAEFALPKAGCKDATDHILEHIWENIEALNDEEKHLPAEIMGAFSPVDITLINGLWEEQRKAGKPGEAQTTNLSMLRAKELEVQLDEIETATDMGAARRFLKDWGEEIRWCEQFGKWLTWEGSHWKVDEMAGQKVIERWSLSLKAMSEEVSIISHAEKLKLYKRFVTRLHGADALKSMLSLAKGMGETPIHQDDLNHAVDHLPCRNGVLNLRTLELQPGRKADYFTSCLSLKYDPEADCPLWIEHLRRCTGGDQTLMRWLWKAFGYTLTGRTDEQCLFFLYGEGQTGKSTTIEVLQHVLGEYSASLDPSKLMAKRFEDEIPSHFARLVGMRMCTAVEVRKEDRFDEGLIKRLTGGDRIQTRFMRKDAFDFTPRFKLYLTGNHKPSIYGQDQGIWRRFRLVPFDKEIPDAQKIGGLKEKLMLEAPGILAWMAAGAQLWYEEGLGACPAIDDATREYRDEQDILGRFIEEKCLIADGSEVKSSGLYNAYKDWAKEEGHIVWNSTRFGNEMRERSKRLGIDKAKREDGNYFVRLTLKGGAE